MDGELDGGSGIDRFFADVAAMREDHKRAGAPAEGGAGGTRGPGRSIAFNEVIENPYGEESVKPGALGGGYAQAAKEKGGFGFAQNITGAGKDTGQENVGGGGDMAFGEQFGEIDGHPEGLRQSEGASVLGD